MPAGQVVTMRRLVGLDFQPGETFAGRYMIVEKAGEGGMGVVYKAIDTILGQTVALKLIQPALARLHAFTERFKNEVRLTRQITHPNVCRVHDIGESRGILHLSMEWIEGETLRQLLAQAGVLKEERALSLAERIASALGAAHAKGIVHRDLKPENVMIDDRGEVFVMDFGLAVERTPEGGGEGGVPGGTPGYMAPEQRRRENVDTRADIYALGMILWEMFMGRLPARDELAQAHRVSGVSRAVVPVLQSLLAEDREKRYASGDVAARALREARAELGVFPVLAWFSEAGGPRRTALLWGGASALLLAAAIGYLWRWSPAAKLSPTQAAPSSPALPASPPLAYYQRGLHYLRAEAETTRGLDDAIQMLHRAVVADPGLVLAWAGLGEAYWKRYERTGGASSREEAEKAVQEALRLDRDLPEAHLALGAGLIAVGKFGEARTELERVVKRRPDFDAAWATLGSAYQELGEYSPGLGALQTAVRLKPGNFRYAIFLGRFYDHFAEYDQAAAAYHKAIDLKPESTMAWNNLGAALLRLDRPAEAIPAFLRSIAIEDHANARSNLGTAYFALGQYRQAAESYRRATALEPNHPGHWGNLGDALKMLGDPKSRDAYREAVRLAREKVAASPNDPGSRELLGLYCAKARENECAINEGSLAATMQPENAEILLSNAVIRCLLGRQDEALDWLERAVKLGLSRAMIQIEPDLAPLHDHPRYRRILELAS